MAAELIPVRGVKEEELPVITPDLTTADLVPFSTQNRMSGIDLPAGPAASAP